MTQDNRTLVLVGGLSPEQRQSLLFGLDEDPMDREKAGFSSTAHGDFGVTALLFVASAITLQKILSWVEKQDESVTVKLELFKIVKLEVNKSRAEESRERDPEK